MPIRLLRSREAYPKPLILLIDALTGTRTLLVLDNLETLTVADQRSFFTFLGHLPRIGFNS